MLWLLVIASMGCVGLSYGACIMSQKEAISKLKHQASNPSNGDCCGMKSSSVTKPPCLVLNLTLSVRAAYELTL